MVDKNGAPINAYVQVEQRENEFPFGAAAAGQILVSEEYQSWFRKRFNWAVHENEAKWYYHAGDNPAFATYEHSDLMTELFQKWNMSIRGHTILWNDGRFVQNWVKVLSTFMFFSFLRFDFRFSCDNFASFVFLLSFWVLNSYCCTVFVLGRVNSWQMRRTLFFFLRP